MGYPPREEGLKKRLQDSTRWGASTGGSAGNFAGVLKGRGKGVAGKERGLGKERSQCHSNGGVIREKAAKRAKGGQGVRGSRKRTMVDNLDIGTRGY